MSDPPPPPEPPGPPAGPPEPPGEPPEPPEPPDETPWRNAPRPRTGGSVWLGILAGVLFFAAVTGVNVLLASLTRYVAVSWIVLILAYLAAAAFIAARPSTARFGSGLFIAVGVSVLLAAGICTALLTTGRLIA